MGRVLAGRYELGELLGQGGMARVYRGTDRLLGRSVAVKVLQSPLGDDDRFVARFRREARAAARVSHPGVVAVFDTGADDDDYFIVQELVEGQPLDQLLKGPMRPSRAVALTLEILGALEAAHRGGVIHRDVKPGNVMVTPSGTVKVMDFGIARAATGETITDAGTVLGTASYVSPEQVQGERVDARSDLYSTGCVLYEMLTGRPPFAGPTMVAVARKHVSETPEPPSRANREVTPALDEVVLRALAKEPDRRYGAAPEMADALRDAVERTARLDATAAPPPGPAPEPTARLPEPGPVSTRRLEEPEIREGASSGRPSGGEVLAAAATLVLLAAIGYVLAFLVTRLFSG